ncbi:MAG: hypothetical protein A3H98_06335 [Bacteroidetes bacterium RIFCSPLOWO2_02_FULL_36_8]|nr:MAG: hypothetical protein A3H98_06335 [Bacteroidetes bacterium RIFCSPLOWO2_02_FULL_36_8]OFY71200.1 MAG: hypothetical protein A3G23_10510 [Bacteroidetes bacterium RIFCSPLOWO2_12_FULL_37_12]
MCKSIFSYKVEKYFFIFFTLLILSSCGSTQVVVPNNSQAKIFQNGKYIGKGSAEITRRGLPKKSLFTAKFDGREIGSVLAKRSFDLLPCLLSFVSYGTGLFFTWKYPETIIIPVENFPETPAKSPWD